MDKFKEGDIVDYHGMFNGPVTSKNHKIKAIEYTPNNYGCDVAWVTGISGCVAMRCLSKPKMLNQRGRFSGLSD